GNLLAAWGIGLIRHGHGLRFGRDGHLWITDVGGHQVFKCTVDGQVLMTLGKPDRPGSGADEFNQPTDVVVTRDGDFYVSDGYGNARIVHFAPNGEFLNEWGRPGRMPGEFDTPH